MLDGCHRKCNVPIRILLVVNIICIYRSSIEKRTDYISNMIYKSGSLKRILVDGGYLENAQSFYVEGKGYKGYGFDKDHFVFMSIENQKERYDLRQIDISVVEQLLKDSIDYIMKGQNDTDTNVMGTEVSTKAHER